MTGSHRWSGRRRVAVAAVALLALAVLGFAALRLWLPRVQGPAEPLTLALSTTPHAGLLHLAAANGYFADEGLAVNLVPVSHGKAAIALLAEGKTDLAAAAEVPFVLSVLQGEPLSVAATVAGVATEMAVVARRDRGIATPQDLVGKRVGVTFGTSGEYFLWAFLIRHKLVPESVTLVDVAPGKMVEALAAGRIDAASTWQPVLAEAQAALGDNGTLFTADSAYTVTHVIVGRSDFMQARPQTMRKLVRALLRAEQFNREQLPQAMTLVAERLEIGLETLEPAWTALTLRVDLRQSQLITLEDEARWAMARGYAPAGALPNFLSHLYLDALLAEQPERVTVVH